MSTRYANSKLVKGLTGAALLLCATLAAAATAFNDPPNLQATPPDLSQSVDPNVILTFDDSGSMASTYMGDDRPYGGSGWGGPWNCAGVIDPRATLASDPKTRGMNGVFYNPNVSYTPPLKEDGTAFPAADATLTAVWADGTSVNRPVSPVAVATAGFNDNPMGVSAGSGARTNIVGNQYFKQVGSAATCTGQPGNCSCSGSGSTKTCITDNRWQCGNSSSWNPGRATANPFDGTVADPDTGAMPLGGPVYWRLKSSVTFAAGTDIGSLGQFTASGLTKLYTASNWEAVSVPVNQYQNFANWYAYYRYRNAMARTVMSRVFGVIGTPTSANIRMLWQNINNTTYGGGSGSLTGLNGKRINSLDDTTADPYGSAAQYRAAFFNWIYQVPAASSTPTRTAEIRAGNFLCNGLNSNCNANSAATVHNDTNPFWSGGSTGQELACRQNFHITMTDGLYNSPAVSVSGNANATSNASANLASGSLPTTYPTADPTTYAPATGVAPTTIYNHPGWTTDSDTGSSFSDIAFYYWANNLRPDFITSYPKDAVPAYYPDQTTGVTGPVATVDPVDPGSNAEVFWNPANDPATWPHMVQFTVTLGAFGTLDVSQDMDCNVDDGFGVGNDDLCKLRKGQTTSAGTTGWPRPNGSGSGIAANIDDLWHAALNSRGGFFVAQNPNALVQQFTNILTSISARAQSSTSEAVSASILNQTTTVAYSGGYDSGSWFGYLYQFALSKTVVATAANWDAGCILTGGTFTPIAPTSTTPPRGSCKVTPTPTPPARAIFTSVKSGSGALTGVPFQWGSLGSAEQGYLNLDPSTTNPDGNTGLVTGTSDGNGTDRVAYLRGKRDNETVATAEAQPRTFRPRKILLGPIVSSQVIYEGGPSSGLDDTFPPNSPEEVAARPCISGLGSAGCNSYEKFVNTYIARSPTLYVGANDGMLHAFDAGTGKEKWAYVPNMLYGNGQLGQLTNPQSTLTVTVDDTPVLSDMFLSGQWRTILVGSMRLGARGIYVLDVTDQSNPGTDAGAAAKFKWEFTSANDPDLGYTYASANTARLANGKWVVLLSSGYFPQRLPVRTASFGSPPQFGQNDTATASTANITHLWVLDADTGAVIKKFNTPSGTISYGLSTPGVIDYGLDHIDDVVVAGDLAGNLWRFDLSSANVSSWTVEVMFQTYTGGSAATPCTSTNPHGYGCEPISVQPVAFPDPVTKKVILVFGSGEYLGPDDKDSSKIFTPQHVFGVRDNGAGAAVYPLHESDLVSQTLTQTGSKRFVDANPVPAASQGWMIPLNITGILGERVVVTVSPIFPLNAAVVTTLIPGANNDPCTPGRLGAVMALDAGTGGVVAQPAHTTSIDVGAEVTNPPATGGVNAVGIVGGGYFIPGVGDINGTSSGNSSLMLNFTNMWRRNSWRQLLGNL